jgi:hypothetical protein
MDPLPLGETAEFREMAAAQEPVLPPAHHVGGITQQPVQQPAGGPHGGIAQEPVLPPADETHGGPHGAGGPRRYPTAPYEVRNLGPRLQRVAVTGLLVVYDETLDRYVPAGRPFAPGT